jgi:hypothetical protein
MSSYKRKEVFDYLTRKPVTTQDIELAKTRIQPPVTPAPMQVTSGEELGTQLELAAGGVVERENYKLGSDFIKDVYKANNISGIRVKKADSGNIYIAGRYTDKDGQRVTTGTKTFNPKTATQKEVTDFLNQTKRQLKGKTYSSATEAILGTSKAKLDYTELRKEYVNDLMEWLDEASKNSKYKTREQIQKDLFKQFNQPKYTEVPKGVHNKSIFFQDGKFSIPRETEIFGRKLGPQKVPEKTINDLSDFFLLKNNPNFEKVRDAAYGFFTQKEADINKYPAEKQKILRNFSREFIKGQFKGEAGESLFLSGLRQEGFNFNNKVNEIFYIQSLKDKITEELSNPNISNNRKNFLNKQLEAINYQKTNITRNLTKLHPNLFRAAKNPGNLVYEHKVPRFIQDMVNLPYDYLARASFAPNALNVYKFEQFDKPLGRLITEYNSTSDATIKNEIKNKIENLKNTFNEKTKVKGQGYLDEVEFKFGNKVKLIDNTPLISDLTNKNVYENILRNIDHSNKFFEKEGLNKYVVKGKDFENYTNDLQNRISTNKGAFYSFPAQVSESTFLGTLAGKSKDAVSNAYSAFKFTGGPINALIGAIINSPEMEEKGLSPAKALTYGAIKGSTEDVLNFGAQILAAGPLMQKTLFEASTEYKKQPPEGIDSFDQVGGKQGLQSKFFNELFSVSPFDISKIPIIGSTWAAEKQTTKETIDNLVNLQTRKQMAELYPSPDISETTVPGENNIMQQQEEQIKKDLYKNIFQDPGIKKEYEQGIAITPEPKKESPPSTGPFYFGTEPSQEFSKGGRVKLQNGSDDGYTQEIPSLGFSDPIDILEQQMINEKDPTRILALDFKLTQMKKRQAEKQKAAEEEKIAQKEKGVRYKEDFPSEADYFIETGKQLVTNPKYFYGKLGKGVVEGTEFLVGQPLQTLFSQTGKNFEFYEPVLGEKLGINKFIKENQPEFPTTGTLLAGDVAEIAGSVLDPFLAYGIVKGAAKASKTKAPVVIEETVDPTRRDLLKMGAVLTGGAIAYPTAKKLGLLETGVKVAKTGNAVRIATHGVVDNMPEFFPYLSEFSLARGKSTGDYMRSGMTEFKRELNLPLEIGGTKKNVKFEFVHDPAEGNVTAYYTNPLTDEKHAFDYYTGKQGKQAYGIDPEFPNAYEYYAVEVEPPGFYYKSPDKADPYRKNFEYYDTATEGDEVIQALDKWYKGLSKEEKAKFEKKFITHSEYTDELPAASNKDENYPIMDYMYPKKKND